MRKALSYESLARTGELLRRSILNQWQSGPCRGDRTPPDLVCFHVETPSRARARLRWGSECTRDPGVPGTWAHQGCGHTGVPSIPGTRALRFRSLASYNLDGHLQLEAKLVRGRLQQDAVGRAQCVELYCFGTPMDGRPHVKHREA